MNFHTISRVCRIAVVGTLLLGFASCITVDETLGENFIPSDQKWHVYTPESKPLKEIKLRMADSLSAYNTTRFTLGAINDPEFGTTVKGSSFTLLPIATSLDFGKEGTMKIHQFHFCAVRDTLSVMHDNQLKMIQNIYVSELKQPLDSNVLYMGAFSQFSESGRANREKYLDLDNRITIGTPTYEGGDSLSFDFDPEWTEDFVSRLRTVSSLDDMEAYLTALPGIYLTTDTPVTEGGRINMFNLAVATSDGYIAGNYAHLKFTAEYEGHDEPVDTSFVFYFGPTEFIEEDDTDYPTQYAFNASEHESISRYDGEGVLATDKIYIEGGSGVKPIIKAKEIKEIVEQFASDEGIYDLNDIIINKATIILPYEVNGNYSLLDKYPDVLSPTVRLRNSSNKDYVSYAGLTDASISTENQGNINRSVSIYSPDISHHIQEIVKLDSNAEDYESTIENYDIWFLIMHEEVVESNSSSNSTYNDYLNNLLYSSYYNNMMYDSYGYGYGYGGYGSGYGYGYNNYYNYLMMAMYASSASASTTSSSSIELDRDRYYNAVLNGPDHNGELSELPRLKITFSIPKSAI